MKSTRELEDRLAKAEEKLQDSAFVHGSGLGNEVRYYIFDYPAEYEMLVRERIEKIKRKSEKSGDEYKVVVFDLYEIMIDVIESKGYLDKCCEFERQKGFERISKSVSNMLKITSTDSIIVNYIKQNTPEKAIILITGIGKCYPVLRAHSIFNTLQQVIDDVPVIMFYPGEYDGQELMLFSEVKDDNYYRAFQLVENS